jgi:beta-galactosidase
VCSNCDHLKFYVGDKLVAEADPDRQTFGNLPHPPFHVNLKDMGTSDLRIEGYIGGRKVADKKYSAAGFDQQFVIAADDTSLLADGSDTTRVTFRIADEFGNLRRYSTAAIAFNIDGPAEIIGENPFSVVGGCGAIWIRAKQQSGTVVLKATHPVLGSKEIRFNIDPAEPEAI